MIKKTTHSTKLEEKIAIIRQNIIAKETTKYYILYKNDSINDDLSDTTALYIKDTAQFLILNGDHTEAYEKCTSLEECFIYFYVNIEQVNILSQHDSRPTSMSCMIDIDKIIENLHMLMK